MNVFKTLEQWELKAYLFAEKVHFEQIDDCGEDYFEAHILQVVTLVKMVTNDEKTIVTAYLHDTIEDTDVTYDELVAVFSPTIANMVMEVTHDGQKDDYGYYFPRLKTKKCILVKFADRLSNLSRMEGWNSRRQYHYLLKSVFWKDGSDLK